MHSKLHTLKKYEEGIAMVSKGGAKKYYYLDFTTESEVEQAVAMEGRHDVGENQFEWRL